MKKIPEVTDQEWEKVNEFNRSITEEFLQQAHLSPDTLTQYKSSLKIFFRWVKDKCQNKPITDLKPRDALNYQNWLINLGLGSSAVKFKRSTVSSLCGHIELYYNEEYPLFRNIYNKKIPNPGQSFVHDKIPLNEDEYKLLCDELEKREEWQMLAYVKFSFASGCRRSEARQLLKEIIDYEKVKDKTYYLTHKVRCKGKGSAGEVRKLQYDDDARNAIIKWLEIRGQDDCPFIFVKKDKNGNVEQLSRSAFNYWCTEIFSEIVGRRVHPHLFRESRATDLVVNKGKDIKSAQKLLGHKSSTTTEIYVIRDDDDDLDDAF